MRTRLLSLVLAGAVTGWAAGTVRASGDATVDATPDEAEVTVGVTTTAADAAGAGEQNAQIVRRVTEALRGTIGKDGTLKTIGYSVEPQYQYGNGKPKLTGYRAVDTLRVRLEDISLAGKVIDAALQAGATEVNGIVFKLRDESKVMNQALKDAAEKAKASAQAIADALNVHVTGVMSAETGSEPTFQPRPLPMMGRSVNGVQGETTVNPGTLEIHATVTVTLAVE